MDNMVYKFFNILSNNNNKKPYKCITYYMYYYDFKNLGALVTTRLAAPE